MAIAKPDLEASLEQYDREQGKRSLYHLTKFVLGYNELEVNPHKDVCDFAQQVLTPKTNLLDLEPRGSFKTTQFSQGLPILAMLNYPNIRILLDSAVLQNSLDNLGVIKLHLSANDRFRYLYGDLVGKHWVTEEITINTRTRTDLKEPTIRCASAERVQVGPHYDLIIADDLVSSENSKTQEGRRAIKEHFKLLFSLLEPTGSLVAVGTRWNYDDLYGMILDGEEYTEFKKRVKSAILPDGSLYFQKRLDQAFIDKQIARQGRTIFYCQYQNDPAPEDENAQFQRAWFKRYEKAPDRRYGFIAIDPGGEKKGSDEWAFMSAFKDEEKYLYLDSLVKGHFRSDKAWDVLFGMIDHVHPLAVGLETTGGQKWLAESLRDEMRRRNKHFNLVELPHAGDSKEYRIKRLQPLYQNGTVLHSPQMGPLEEQLLRFPKGKDDVADVASMILEIAFAPAKSKKAQDKPKTLDEMIMQQAARQMGRNTRHVHSVLGSEF